MPRERLYWKSNLGVSVDLTDWQTYFALKDRIGFWSPQYRISAFQIPEQPGAVVQSVKARERMIDLPILIRGTSNKNLRNILRELSHLLCASNGDGKLSSVDEDGMTREINCRYLRGLEAGKEMPASLHCTLSFQASDPYWYSASYTEMGMSGGIGISRWFPIFPLRLSNSLVLGTAIFSNPGDDEGWPIWTIVGPASAVKIENESIGKEIEFVGYSLSDNTEQIIIDTRSGYKTVQDQGGTNLMGYLSSTSSLFPIVIGKNTITVTMTGTTPASSVNVKIKARYLSA